MNCGQDLVELCLSAISVDSSKSAGTHDIARHYGEWAQARGLSVDIIDDVYLGIPQSLLVVRPPTARANQDLVLSAYLETKDPEDYHLWTKTGGNPFSASLDGEHLYGLGASGPKIDFACKLYGLANLVSKEFLTMNPVLVGGFGVESGIGTLRMLRKRQLSPKLALVGQGTDLKMGTRAPGYAVLEVTIPFSQEEKNYQKNLPYAENLTTQTKMFSVEESVFSGADLSVNPILQLLNYVKQLPAGMSLVGVDGGRGPTQFPETSWLEIQLLDGVSESILPKLGRLSDTFLNLAGRLKEVPTPEFSPPYSSFNVGAIKTKPDGVHVFGSCNFNPGVTKSHYDDWLDELQKSCEKIGAHVDILDFRQPLEAEPTGPLVDFVSKALRRENLNAEFSVSEQCSEANIFSRFKIDTLLFGPGRMSRDARVANESVLLKNLDVACKVYESVVGELCI